jgi:hypothetical protein
VFGQIERSCVYTQRVILNIILHLPYQQMPASWNDEITCKFVELYKEHERLWNMHSNEYRNKNARQTDLEKMFENIGWENLTTEDSKQKIKSLRAPTNKNLIKLRNLRDPELLFSPYFLFKNLCKLCKQ